MIAESETPIETNLKNVTESSIAHNYVDELVSIMDSDINNNVDIDDHVTALKDLENLILIESSENQNLADIEKVVLLMATSVARHSSAYWHNVQYNQTLWGDVIDDGGSTERNWKDVAQADLRGFAEAVMRTMVVGVILILATGGVSALGSLTGIGISAIWSSAKAALS